jgi:uncharacterized membrane protein YecN with MAPEG domain
MTGKQLALLLLSFALVMGVRAARVAHADGVLVRLMSRR